MSDTPSSRIPDTTMDADLEAIRARCEAARIGPWRAAIGKGASQVVSPDGAAVYINVRRFPEEYDEETTLQWTRDAEFIAHARSDIPALLSRLEARERELAEARTKQGEIIAQWDRDLDLLSRVTRERDDWEVAQLKAASEASELRRLHAVAVECYESQREEVLRLRSQNAEMVRERAALSDLAACAIGWWANGQSRARSEQLSLAISIYLASRPTDTAPTQETPAPADSTKENEDG